MFARIVIIAKSKYFYAPGGTKNAKNSTSNKQQLLMVDETLKVLKHSNSVILKSDWSNAGQIHPLSASKVFSL